MCWSGMAQTIMLEAPTNGAIDRPTDDTLIWSQYPSAGYYNIQLSLSTSFMTTVISQTGIPHGRQYIIVNNLDSATTYYWEVSVTNAGITSAWTSIWSFTTIPIPGAPVLISPSDNAIITTKMSETLITFCWHSSIEAFGYEIQYGFNSQITSGTSTQDTFSQIEISKDSTYYWRIGAYDSSGGQPHIWSSWWMFTISAPTSTISKDNSLLITPTCNVQNGIIHYSMPKQMYTNITLYNMSGKMVFNSSVVASAGAHRLSMRNILSAGSYIVRFKANGFEKNIVAAFM